MHRVLQERAAELVDVEFIMVVTCFIDKIYWLAISAESKGRCSQCTRFQRWKHSHIVLYCVSGHGDIHILYCIVYLFLSFIMVTK